MVASKIQNFKIFRQFEQELILIPFRHVFVFSAPAVISINAPWYHTRAGGFLRVDFHPTNYGVHEPLNGAVRSFNEFTGLFDLHLSRNQFFNRLRSVL
jgi:hypothetical protein